MGKDKTSTDSLTDANRSRASFSGHGHALGAAGKREASFDPENSEFLRQPGQSLAVSPGPDGFDEITITVSWDNISLKNANFFGKLLKKATHAGVDLDLGCLYELKDGTRGACQAFGEKFGSFNKPPYIKLSQDDRTGDGDGVDEFIKIKGVHWADIRQVLIYVYIYKGPTDWGMINPHLMIDIPGENDLVVTLHEHDESLRLCVIGGLENVRNGIKLTNYTEYFPGHAEMDRAFGFGLEWGEGSK